MEGILDGCLSVDSRGSSCGKNPPRLFCQKRRGGHCQHDDLQVLLLLWVTPGELQVPRFAMTPLKIGARTGEVGRCRF